MRRSSGIGGRSADRGLAARPAQWVSKPEPEQPEAAIRALDDWLVCCVRCVSADCMQPTATAHDTADQDIQILRVSSWVDWWWQGEPCLTREMMYCSFQNTMMIFDNSQREDTALRCGPPPCPVCPASPAITDGRLPLPGPARTMPPPPLPERNSSSSSCCRCRFPLTTSHCPLSLSPARGDERCSTGGVLDGRRGCPPVREYPARERTSQLPRRYVPTTQLVLNFPAELGSRPSLLPLGLAWVGPWTWHLDLEQGGTHSVLI